MFSILHISDLHKDAGSRISNTSLLESLRLDKERYLTEGLLAPNLAVVTGDIVYGVTSLEAGSDEALTAQYEDAENFLVELSKLFFKGDRERVILVPGNHDVSHPHVLRATALSALPKDKDKRELLAQQIKAESSQWRWSWSEFAARRIFDEDHYHQRMEPFATFYKSFYQGSREYPLSPKDQYLLHDFPELGIVVAALSSCCDNDLFNRSGRIHPDCVAGVTRASSEYVKKGRIPIAVWHHNLAGGPRDSDYVDGEFLQSLMDGMFVIGLHGHQHRPQFFEHRFTADKNRSLAVISAGTLCGGPRSLPTGRMRAYNLLEIDIELRKCTLHIREMKNSSFSMPVWGAAHVPEFSGSSIAFDLSMRPLADFGDDAASEAIEFLRQGDAKKAFSIVEHYSNNEFARRVAVEALEQMRDWNAIRDFCAPPQSNVEIIKLLEALYELNDMVTLKNWVETDKIRNSDDAAVKQCVDRALSHLSRRR